MKSFWLIIFLPGVVQPVFSQYARIYENFLNPQLNEIRLTSHPKNETEPAVSFDGEWLAFVSDRNGNPDIFVMPVNGGRVFQITHHKAADYSPCWLPDNSGLYFISARSDAEGDLWQVQFNPDKLPGTKMRFRQIDTYLGYDDDPVCSPDGKFVALTTTRLSGNRNIWIVKPETENVVPFTLTGGEAPGWSPDGSWIVYSNFRDGEKNPQSDLFIKRFDPDSVFAGIGLQIPAIQLTNTEMQETDPVLHRSEQGLYLYFLRHEIDQNRDRLTDFNDAPSLLCTRLDSAAMDSLQGLLKSGLQIDPLEPEKECHLSAVDSYIRHPAVGSSGICFSEKNGEGYDLFKIPLAGAIKTFDTVQDQFAWADSVFNPTFQNLLELDGDSVFAAAIYNETNQLDKAIGLLNQLQNRNDLTLIEHGYLSRQLERLQIRLARQLEQNGEFRQAYDQYWHLCSENPDNLEAQRGLVFTADRLNQLQQLKRVYENHVKNHPQNDSYLYTLGLIYSLRYKNDVKKLVEADRYLQRALEINPRMIYGYLTLSSNYVRLDEFQQEYFSRRQGWVARTARTIFAPAIWLYRTITLKKAAKFQNWNERAIQLLQLALEINDEHVAPGLEAIICLNLANSYYQMGELTHEKAYEFYLKKSRYDSTFSRPEQEAEFFFRLGHSSLSVQDWPRAENCLQKAVHLYRQTGNTGQTIAAQKLLALNYQLAGKYNSAIELYLKTVSQDSGHHDFQALLKTYRNIAFNYLYVGDAEQVRQYCLKSLELLESNRLKNPGRPSTAIRLEFLGYSIPVWSLGNLAPSAARSLYGFSGDDEKAFIFTILFRNAANQKQLFQALNMLKEKLKIFRQSEDVIGQALVLNNLGMMYSALGNDHLAGINFSQSLEICRKENLLAGEIINTLNLSRLSLTMDLAGVNISAEAGDLLDQMDRLIERISDYPFSFQEERVDLVHQSALLGFSLLRKELRAEPAMNSTLRIPAILKNHSEFADLLDRFERASELARKNAFFRRQTLILKNSGELYCEAGFYEQAENAFREALSLADENGFDDLKWPVLLALANLNANQSDSLQVNQLEESRQTLLYQIVFSPDKVYDLPAQIAMSQLYTNLIRKTFSAGEIERALLLCEEYQNLQKLDQVRRIKLGFADESKKINAQKYQRYITEMNHLEMKVDEIKKSRRGGYRRFYQVVDSLAGLSSEFDDFLFELRKTDPELLSLYRPLDLNLRELQSQIDKKRCLINFFSGGESLYAWCLTSDSLWCHRSAQSAQNLTQRIEQFTRQIQTDSLFPDTLAHYFFEKLLLPFEKQLKDRTELIIVGESPFINLPFGLIREGARFLADRLTICTFPTLTDFYLTGGVEWSGGTRVSWFGRAPEFIEKNELPGYRVTLFRNSSLTEEKFRSQFFQSDYLMLNRPLLVNDQPVLQSYFQFVTPFSGKSTNQFTISLLPNEGDGFFYLSDLFSLHGDGGIIFMLFPQDSLIRKINSWSAVQTAWRNVGLTAYIMLRWPVTEQIKTEFLNYFFSAVEKSRPFEAFVQAQKELYKIYRNPAIWGAFVWRGSPD